MHFPRVVHVGSGPIGEPTNTGMTLDSMFGAWPDVNLLQVCLRDNPTIPRRGRITVVPMKSAPIDGLLRTTLGSQRRLQRRAAKGVPSRESDGLNNATPRRPSTIRQRAGFAVSVVNDVGPVWLPPSLRRQVSDFRPTVLHSLLGGVQVMRLTLALSRYLRVPVVPHFMDDWVGRLFADGQLWGFAGRQAARVFDQLLARSPLMLTIGEDMRREFEQRFHRPCAVVGNSVDPAEFAAARATDLTDATGTNVRADRPTMRYVGGLHLGRDQVLATAAETIERTEHSGRRWQLELYVPDSDNGRARRLADRFESVSYRGSVAPPAVPRTLLGADALLFLESQQPGLADFTRLSVSTKVPQYLAAGRPILAIGPRDQGSIRTLQRVSRSVLVEPGSGAAAMQRGVRELYALIGPTTPAGPANPPDWFLEEFGRHATQERLRKSLLAASTEARAADDDPAVVVHR